MDHLFNDFMHKGIHAFKDDRELPKGEEISPHLYKTIEESRFLIVIFSKNYTSSTWCLRLSKYLSASRLKTLNMSTEVGKWKEALSIAANLSGWDLQDMTNGYEYKFIDCISKDILKKLCDEPLHIGENIVGTNFHFEILGLSCFVCSYKVHMIGIYVQGVSKRQGLTQVQIQMIGNIMKTEDLKVSSVGEGIMVIKHMIACKPILLVSDDVDDHEQLEALVGKPTWFCPGSLTIFTGKDKQLLRSHKVDGIYEMESLDDCTALELFSLYAFGKRYPTEDFGEFAS
ncbi:NB-ARC domains-containing protein [Tanacetum coccineum]